MRTSKKRGDKPPVQEIDPLLIDFNPQNPRGETEDEIEEDPEFVQLRESVAQFHVMVPLVVTPSEQDASRYMLIDGERRLRAALSVNEKTVPVHVVPSDSARSLAQSFHIHTLRKQWTPIAQVRAVRRLIKLLQEESPGVRRRESELLKRISALTGLRRKNLERFVRTALRYREKDLRDVEVGRLNVSYIWEIEESFVEPLKSTFPDLLSEFGEKVVRGRLLAKARRGVLAGTRGLREFPSLFARAESGPERTCLRRLLKDFVEHSEMSPEEVILGFGQRFPQGGEGLLQVAEGIADQVGRLQSALQALTIAELRRLYPASAKHLVSALRSLNKRINSVIGRSRG